MIPLHIPIVSLLLVASALAQANTVPGTDVNLYSVDASTIFGRRGPAYPNGEVGVGFGHAFCNGGTVHVPWVTSPTTSGQMTDQHFKIAFLVARESNGRMVQVSKRNSFVKHSRVTYNLGSSNCGTCQNGPPDTFSMGCYDAYTTGYNGDRFNLGPPEEIDPWLGSWNPVGSYFDRGDPAVTGAAASDGTQSLTQSQANAFDSVKNRVIIDESELSQPGNYFGQAHLVCEGEPVANRGNNQRSNRLTFNWSGSSWMTNNTGGSVAGSVLNQWTGANVSLGGNGIDDGRFAVAVKVTGPVAGMYHYEYAVHNIDNNRGGASFRIPLNAPITVQNAGFRDIDTNPLNEWTFSQTATELTWSAAANNALDWNTIYNFHFDCNSAPGVGGLLIDQARIGAGQLTVAIVSEAPGGQQPALVSSIGSACGHCNTTFYEYFPLASGMDLSNTSATLAFVNGAYNVGTGTSSYQTPTGNNLGLGDDTQIIVNLPFTLPYPGGTTTALRICSNGFVGPAGDNTTLWIPLVNVFLNLQPRWAVAWHDYAPQLGGQVIFEASPAGAMVTWQNVRNSGTTAPGISTFQIQFRPSGTVHMVWGNMATTGNAYLVGWTPGQAALDPGNSNLTTALPAGISLCATSPQRIALSTNARPILGTTIQQITSNIAPFAGFGVTVMSLTQAVPAQDLTSLGMAGCFAHTQNGVNQLWYSNGAATVSVPLTIPNDSSLNGVQVVSQSYAYVPPLTVLGIIASNGLLMQVGPL